MSPYPLSIEEEQWTVVGKGKKSKKKRCSRTDQSVRSVHSNSSQEDPRALKKLNYKILQAKSHQEVLLSQQYDSGKDISNSVSPNELMLEEVTPVLKALQNCVKDLWNFGQDNFFCEAYRRCTYERSKNTTTSSKFIREIVCYGVGNFSRPYSPSMIQLAVILLFREILILSNQYHDGNNNNESDLWEKIQSSMNTDLIICDGKKKTHSTTGSTVTMSFFDPCTSTMEAFLLENHLNTKVLHDNSQGKCTVQHNQPTLFFMPHCPMRLYSNLLWANWDEETLCNNILIIGNSLLGYDNSIIDSGKRSDETNGIFRIIPHVRDTPLNFPLKKAMATMEFHEAAVGLQKAFNDCSFMSFQTLPDAHWPKKPLEYVNDGSDNGELIHSTNKT